VFAKKLLTGKIQFLLAILFMLYTSDPSVHTLRIAG